MLDLCRVGKGEVGEAHVQSGQKLTIESGGTLDGLLGAIIQFVTATILSKLDISDDGLIEFGELGDLVTGDNFAINFADLVTINAGRLGIASSDSAVISLGIGSVLGLDSYSAILAGSEFTFQIGQNGEIIIGQGSTVELGHNVEVSGGTNNVFDLGPGAEIDLGGGLKLRDFKSTDPEAYELAAENVTTGLLRCAADRTILNSFNIESVTKAGTGLYDIVFKREYDTVGYVAVVNINDGTVLNIVQVQNEATTGLRIRTWSDQSTGANLGFQLVIVGGDY